jgi:hypothetical protein
VTCRSFSPATRSASADAEKMPTCWSSWLRIRSISDRINSMSGMASQKGALGYYFARLGWVGAEPGFEDDPEEDVDPDELGEL